MQQKVSQLVPKKSVSMSTGVAGVRGAKEDTHAKLYWKGKKGEETINEEELAEFKEGLDRAAKGDTAEAIHEFDEFLKLYPDSALVPDVKKALDMAKLEQLDEKKAEFRRPRSSRETISKDSDSREVQRTREVTPIVSFFCVSASRGKKCFLNRTGRGLPCLFFFWMFAR